MPALISDWRSHWAAASGTASNFPFGLVQLAPWGGATSGVVWPPESLGVSTTRWGQTANYGYLPNPKQPRTFMAVAIDLGAYQGGCCAGRRNCNTYPSLCIHPWWKQEVGRRLSLGMMAIGYNQSSVCHQGPFPSSAKLVTAATTPAEVNVKVTFRQQAGGGCGTGGIELRRTDDFELKLVGANWTLATIVSSDHDSVTLTPQKNTSHTTPWKHVQVVKVEAVRYLWSKSPGSHPRDDSVPGNTSIYWKGDEGEGLPAPPFFINVS